MTDIARPTPSTPSPVLYLSGPITGHHGYRADFLAAALRLEAEGYRTHNPCYHRPSYTLQTAQAPDRPSWADWMRPALAALTRVDGVALLDGWQDSRGATWEARIAAEVLHLPVLTVAEWCELGGMLP